MIKEQCFGFLSTPALWTGEEFGINQFVFPEVNLNRFLPKPISKKLRLGHQMEHVFTQLLIRNNTYDLILHNQPVKDENRTIGEIDFILKHRETEKLIHVELTYKFYIIDPTISEPIHRLIGPNRKDMFFTKMEKIRDKQFPLLHSKNGIKTLEERQINHEEIEHQACFKAQLYMPYANADVDITPLNKNCVYGYWLKFKAFEKDDFKNHQYYIPSKSEWVIPPHKKVRWSSHFETLMEVNLHTLNQNAPMLWMKKSDTEFQKFFVVWW
ncbi:DUF1853 family protein [Zobellia laminariae]|uniref:DUF1853 family protein n=1 Tax=Zobellia laminariae TaxID=248906 RepID=UPI00405695C9